MMPFQVDRSLNIYVRYFHAMALKDSRNIFTSNAGSVMMNGSSGQVDVTAGAIKPLTDNRFLIADGNDLLIPLAGQLFVPPNTTPGKWPIVIIGHGQHRTQDDNQKRLLSYQGYTALQEYLANKGIASYSMDLYLVNLLTNNEDTGFKVGALDNNQRILLFFLHLKLLKIMAGETVNEPAATDESTILFLNGTGFDNIKNAISPAASSPDPALQNFSNQLFGKIDFTKIGFMGHSRGADTVSRIPAYFYKGSVLADPSFPFNAEVNNRIKKLSGQIGQPQQDYIKAILALEPTATLNKDDPDKTAAKQGYVINNSQTVYFLGAGTNDEDVSFDVVRMYEYPQCSKAMIAVNGASHKRYNTVWANDIVMKDGKAVDEFDGSPVPPHLLQLGTHTEILKNLYGACFTGTLTANTGDLQYITKEKPFAVAAMADVEFQSAWKYGVPIDISATTLNNIADNTVTGLSKNKLDNGSDSLVQDLQALTVKKDNAGISAIKIPVTPGSSNDLSKFTHFSFRFAKFFNPSSLGNRVEEKNFTIQLFAGTGPLGKPIAGKNITTLELKPFNAFHLKTDNTRELRYYILLQTVEVSLPGSFTGITAADLARVTRIEVNIIPDVSKKEPHGGATVVLGTIGGGVVGTVLGAYGGHLVDGDDATGEIIGGVLGAAVGAGGLYYILKSDTNVFAFTDFLLTNRQ